MAILTNSGRIAMATVIAIPERVFDCLVIFTKSIDCFLSSLNKRNNPKENKMILNEELTQKHKDKIDSWYVRQNSSIKSLHDKVFGEGNDHVVIDPEPKSEENRISSDNKSNFISSYKNPHATVVFDLLHNKGFRVHDYEAGLAYHNDKPNRKMSIGKILETIPEANNFTPRTDVTNSKGQRLTFKQAYANDPIRSGGNGKIVISRNKYDVAGVSSHVDPNTKDQKQPKFIWSSCMNLTDGCNRHYLPHDLEHGTLAAYFTTEKNPTELKTPAGRQSIKLHQSMMDKKSSMVPESSHYGNMNPRALRAIQKWTEENYPKENDVYVKHPSLYNDDGERWHTKSYDPSKASPDQLHNMAEKVSSGLIHQFDKDIDSYTENQDREYEKYGYTEGDINGDMLHHATKAISKVTDKMDTKTKATFVLHNAVAGLDNYDRYDREHPEDEELNLKSNSWDDGHTSSDLFHHAMDSNSFYNRHFLSGQTKHLDDKVLHNLVGEAQKHIQHQDIESAEYGFGKHASDVYNALTTEVVRRHMAEPEKHQYVVDSIIQHHLDHHEMHDAINYSHKGYDYPHGFISKIGEPGRTPIGHMMTLTKSVPLMHEYLNHLDDYSGKPSDYDYKGLQSIGETVDPHIPLEHFGEHGTLDLSKRILRSKHLDLDEVGRYTQGLNKNKNGELIQHEMTSGFHFPEDEESEFSEHHAAFKSFAQHSTIPSVLKKLSTRSDISDEVKEIASARLGETK